MTGIIVHRFASGPVGDRGGPPRDYRRFSPVQQRRLHSNSQRASSGRADAGFGNRELITERIRVGRGPALGEVGKVTFFGRKPTRPALNFPRLTKAAGSLFSPRVQACKQARSSFANRFHLSCVASAFHEQKQTIGAFGNVKKDAGEVTNAV